MRAGTGFEMLLVPVINERVEPVNAFGDHIAAGAAVATIGSAKLDVFFSPETNTAGAAVTRPDIDLCLI